MKRIFFISFLLWMAVFQVKSESEIKLNGLYAVFGIINPAFEIEVANNFSMQLEVVVSPWQEYIYHAPMLFTVGFLEGRW